MRSDVPATPQIDAPDPAPRASSRERLKRRLRHPSRAAIVRIVLAATLVAVSYKTNRSFLGWGLLAIFAILVVPLGRARSFLLSFAPYTFAWFAFTALRSLADETVIARTLNTKVPALERWIFRGQLPTIMLQDRLFNPLHLHWYDYLCTGVHWSYFIVPHAVAIRTWYKNPEFFRHYLSAMTLLIAMGLCIYFLIPTNPPWLAPEAINSPSAPVVYRVMESVGKSLGGGLYNASYRVIGESNPIAAMPSMHMAITFLTVFPAIHAGRKWAGAAFVYSAMMAFSLVYMGEHYIVDVTVGVLITVYAWFAAGIWLHRVAPALRMDRSRSVGLRPPASGKQRTAS